MPLRVMPVSARGKDFGVCQRSVFRKGSGVSLLTAALVRQLSSFSLKYLSRRHLENQKGVDSVDNRVKGDDLPLSFIKPLHQPQRRINIYPQFHKQKADDTHHALVCLELPGSLVKPPGAVKRCLLHFSRVALRLFYALLSLPGASFLDDQSIELASGDL